MSLAVLRSRALAGMEAPAVSVEVHLANGLPSMTIVGTKHQIRRRLRAWRLPARRAQKINSGEQAAIGT